MNSNRPTGRVEDNTMASSLVAASLQGLPNRRNIAQIVATPLPRIPISPAHAKAPITVQSRPLPSEKPLISGSGITCSIQLAEPHVYLTGFDHDGRGNVAQNTAALIRGKLILNVHKSVKIKAVTLRFYGKARTEWPEGMPPEKTQFHEEEKFRYQVLPFYNALYSSADVGYGAQCNYVLRNPDAASSTTNLQAVELLKSKTPAVRNRSGIMLSARDQKRLSLQTVQSRSFQKGESPATTTQQKGYKTFHPGVYEYSFEITLDHSCPETMDLPMGSVHWMLEAIIERAGTFKPNLHGAQEVIVVRAPDQGSLEQVEPIAISRKWEDQLHYDIVISGKSFPIGSKIPIAFKLTPLAKVQCHRIKVYVIENVDYYCRGKRVTRKDAQRKILLLERNAGKPLAPEYTASDIRILAGGELTGEGREHARTQAENWRRRFAKLSGTTFEPLPAPTDNLLGDLDLGLDHLITQTEIEMDVQLPTCEQMQKDKTKILHPDTTYKNIQVHHWIKIVMRLSRLDTEDPTGTKRRHFEISIDSPFHILSCLATQAHTSLPEYCGSNPGAPCQTFECGCPNAAAIFNASPASSTGSIPSTAVTSTRTMTLGADGNALPSLSLPAQAHLAMNGGPVQRPIHMLRTPSFNPPAFEAEEPPPPIETPPPLYDQVIGTPSVDGLADYFARLADAYSDDDHSEDELDLDYTISRSGRVNVPNPRTPGQRAASRSMDINRNFMFRPESFNPRLQAAREQQQTIS